MRYIKAWAVCEKVKAIKVKASFQENEIVRFGEWPSPKDWYLIDFILWPYHLCSLNYYSYIVIYNVCPLIKN